MSNKYICQIDDFYMDMMSVICNGLCIDYLELA